MSQSTENDAARQAKRDAQALPHVRCYRPEEHAPHRHINEGPRGGCGLPEWCNGRVIPPGRTDAP